MDRREAAQKQATGLVRRLGRRRCLLTKAEVINRELRLVLDRRGFVHGRHTLRDGLHPGDLREKIDQPTGHALGRLTTGLFHEQLLEVKLRVLGIEQTRPQVRRRGLPHHAGLGRPRTVPPCARLAGARFTFGDVMLRERMPRGDERRASASAFRRVSLISSRNAR